MKQAILLGALAFGASGLGACATEMVQTGDAAGVAPAGTRYLGDYGLARSMFTITVSEAGSGGAKADDKVPAAVVTNPNNSPASPAPAVPGAGARAAGSAEKDGGKTPETEGAWCADLRKSYNQDRIATLIEQQAFADIQAHFTGWLTDAPQTYAAAESKAILKQIDAYMAVRGKAELAVERGRGTLKLIQLHCPQRVRVDIKETVEVDHARTFRLYAKLDNLSADHWVAEFDGAFPKTISGTADHKLGAVFEAAARSIGSFQALGAAPPPPTTAASAGVGAPGLQAALKAVRTGTLTAQELERLAERLVPLATLERIDALLPIIQHLSLADLEAGPRVIDENLGLVVLTTCSPAGQTQVPTNGTPDPAAAVPAGGVVISAARACELVVPAREDVARWVEARRRHAGMLEAEATRAEAAAVPTRAPGPGIAVTLPVQARLKVWALDSRSFAVLPVDRTALVKTTTAYAFTSGRPAKAEFDRPAPLLEVVSLPFRVSGALLGGFVDGVKGKNAKIEAETGLTRAETARIQAEIALAEARREAKALEAAQTNDDDQPED